MHWTMDTHQEWCKLSRGVDTDFDVCNQIFVPGNLKNKSPWQRSHLPKFYCLNIFVLTNEDIYKSCLLIGF